MVTEWGLMRVGGFFSFMLLICGLNGLRRLFFIFSQLSQSPQILREVLAKRARRTNMKLELVRKSVIPVQQKQELIVICHKP